MKVLACGPYIGDFEQEIITFRPYCRWLYEVVDHDKIYLNTHFNRFFLYDFIPNENKISTYMQFTRNEIKQKGYIHKNVSKRDYNLFVKMFKDNISKREKCSKRDIDLYNISYLKSTPAYPIYKKIFEPIKTEDFSNDYKSLEDKILFIPSFEENEKRLKEVLSFLEEKYKVIVGGNIKTRFYEKNIIFKNPDWFETVFKRILYLINNCKAVVCPISFWTTICNLQKVKVFSWGPIVAQHKEDGIYNLGNKNISTIPVSKEDDMKNVKKGINFFMEKIL